MPSESTPQDFLDRLQKVAEDGEKFTYDNARRKLDGILPSFQDGDLARLEQICRMGRKTINRMYSGSMRYRAISDYIALFTRADHAINGPPNPRNKA